MLTLRLFVLLLVAVLLPVRGAAGAAMLCAGGSDAGHGHVAAHAGGVPAPAHHDEDGHSSPHAHGHGVVAGPAAAGAEQADAAPGGLTEINCHLCASGCSATPLLGSPPEVVAPVAIAEVEYPAMTARAPVFHAEAHERPPRSG